MGETVSLERTPVVDCHCFAYGDSPLTREGFLRLFPLGGLTVGSVQTASRELAEFHSENTIAYRAYVRELAGFLECAPSLDEVLKARNARAADFTAYASALMEDAGIETLLVDNATGTLGEVDEFGRRFPGTVRKTLRLETLVRDLLDSSGSFESLVSGFDEALEDAVTAQGCVAFKSIIAYRTGLDIRRVDEAEAEQDFNQRADGVMWFGPYVKRLRDYLLRRALVRSISLQVPVLVHTGLGDTDILASQCNAALLADLLKDEEIMPARVVLIHGGFPYTYEAGWLASVLPNVYFELSACLPPLLEPAMSVGRYRDVLRWVPLTKLVYGSDGSDYPETLWHHARTAKRAMSQALNELVEGGLLSLDEALGEGENIFFNNATKLFGL